MRIEDELFHYYNIDRDKLIKYGFFFFFGCLLFEKNILDDKFTIIVTYDTSMRGVVIDNDFHEEYTNFRRDVIGKFSAIVKDEFIKLFIDIRECCAVRDVFLFSQTKRINQFILERYGISPEFLWEKSPGFAVYRKTKKWFALIGNVSYYKVDKSSSRTDEVEVLNLKIVGCEIASLLKKHGYYEAYHMNKKNWISIILDDTLLDDEIEEMIVKSYSAVNERQVWLLPANPSYYDVIHCFDKDDVILWKQSTDVQVDDIIFLYVASPYSKIYYCCKVIEVDIPYDYEDKNIKMQKVMKIQLVARLDQFNYDFSYLKKLGIKAIRGPRKINKDVYQYFSKGVSL